MYLSFLLPINWRLDTYVSPTFARFFFVLFCFFCHFCLFFIFKHQVGADGLPTSKLAGDSLTACEKIDSTATTIEEAKEDPKVRQTEPTSW